MSFEERLINLVRDREILFNLKSRHYRNAIKKEEVWKNISEKLNVLIPDCKQRWKSLRDRFRKECAHNDMPSGSARKDRREWEHFQTLCFLKDSMKLRKTCGNYSTEYTFNDECLSSDTSLLSPPTNMTPSPATTFAIVDVNEVTAEIMTPPTPVSSNLGRDLSSSIQGISAEMPPTPSPQASRKRKTSNDDSIERTFASFLEEIRNVVNVDQSSLSVAESCSENELFMKLASRKLDMLPENIKNETQMEILKLITDKIQMYGT